MQSRLAYCLNSKCTGFKITLETASKRCGICQSRLKNFNYQTDDKTDDAPPVRGGLLLTVGSDTATDPDEPVVFESNCDVADKCPVAPSGGTIHVPYILYTTWVFLCNQIPVEWIAYLRGEVDAKGDIYIDPEGMYFPEQKANGVHVDAALNAPFEDGTIAAIHSHVKMGVTFSNEDFKHFNHPCDMVVNAYGSMDAVVRRQLDCKRYARVPAKVLLKGTETDVGALHTLKSKLTIEPPPQHSHSSNGRPISDYDGNSYFRGTTHGGGRAPNRMGFTVLDSRRSHEHGDNDRRRD